MKIKKITLLALPFFTAMTTAMVIGANVTSLTPLGQKNPNNAIKTSNLLGSSYSTTFTSTSTGNSASATVTSSRPAGCEYKDRFIIKGKIKTCYIPKWVYLPTYCFLVYLFIRFRKVFKHTR